VNPLSPKRDDSAALSSIAKDIDRISALVDQSREDRIAQVRGMLETGTYKVSSFDVALKLIECNKR
jgi:anti-sigma28 factor (negative regulator of flagellin synthesis)